MTKRILILIAIIGALSYGSQAQVDVKIVQTNISQCDTAGMLNMPITVVNSGTVPIIGGAPIILSYRVNGGTLFSETPDFASNFNPGDTVTFTFTTPYHFNQFTTYNCMFAIDYLGDADVTNDTANFTSTFFSLPGYGNHSSDTAVCIGSPANLMMELTGNGPWAITFVMGPDTMYGMPISTSTIETEMTLDSTMTFGLVWVMDVNGCSSYIGQSITITVNDYPVVNLGTDTIMCAGQSLLIDAGHPGATYNWWNGPGSQTYAADTSDWAGVLGHQLVWVDVDLYGCVSRDSLDVEWIVCPDGISENNIQGFELYPNPTTGKFSLVYTGLTGTISCEILNHVGQQVYAETFVNFEGHATHECYPGNLSTGVYYVVMHNDAYRLVKKLIVE